VKTNRTTPNNKLSTIIRDKEKEKFVSRKDNFRRWTCDKKNKPKIVIIQNLKIGKIQ